MPDQEMIERCARAAYEALDADKTYYVGSDEDLEDVVLDGSFNLKLMIKAIIKAMRDPSEKLIDVGLRATAIHLDIKGSQLTVNRGKMLARFNAMIDSILND